MRRTHLVAAFLAFAALCMGVSGLSVWRDRIETLEQARQQVAATASVLDEHASRAIDSSDVVLQQIVDTLTFADLRDPDLAQRQWTALRRRIARLPQVADAWVAAADGTLLLDSRFFPAPPASIIGRAPVEALKATTRPLLISAGTPTGRSAGADAFTVSRAIRSPDGHLLGAVGLSIQSMYFNRLYGETGWGPEARFTLYDDDRQRLAQWPPGEDAGPPPGVWPEPWDPAAGPAVRRGSRIIASRRLAAYPVVVTVSRPLGEALAGWRERATWTAGIAVGALFGAALLGLNGLAGIRREETAQAALKRANQSLDERVRRRTEELEEALRLAETASLAKMKVLATVSHDLRQPLQGLAAFHELLLKESPNPDLHRLGAMATASLQAGQRLLDDLLTLSRLEAGVVPVEVGAFALAPLLDQLAAELRGEVDGKGIALTVVPTTLWVRSDPARLQQILRNLLSNAVKYTARGGVVVGARRRRDRVRVEVWDSGPGIPEAELGTIWEEFYQIGNPARDGSRGAGLGLSIVDRTARLLGHALEVRSRPGRGSVFAVTLPRVPAPATAAPVAIAPVPAAEPMRRGRLEGRLVLVVEDDLLQRHSLTLLLEQAGATVMAVETFSAALAGARAGFRRPAAILTDYRLPGGMDGLAGIQAMRQALEVELPAILLTGELSSDLARAAKAAGCALLTKPAPPDRILSLLATLTDAAAA